MQYVIHTAQGISFEIQEKYHFKIPTLGTCSFAVFYDRCFYPTEQ